MSDPERRVERPSEILRPLSFAADRGPHYEATLAILDQLHASQLRADKFVAAMAKVWAMPCDGEPDEESRACKFAAREYLTPEPQSQTAVEVVTFTEHDQSRCIYAYAKNGHCLGGWRPNGQTIVVGGAFKDVGEVDISHSEAIRLIPAIADKYPIPPAKAVEPASESAEDWAARIVPESDSGARIYSHESGGGGTSISPRCEQLLPEWRAVARQHIANALRAYAASERDALKLRAEELGKELGEAKRVAALAESKLSTVRDHLTQWNLATTNAAANTAISNAFNEVTQ